jgi:hypothetical protein
MYPKVGDKIVIKHKGLDNADVDVGEVLTIVTSGGDFIYACNEIRSATWSLQKRHYGTGFVLYNDKPLLGGKMKEYIEKHQNLIFTLLSVVILDHVLLKGALRKKLEAVANKMLENVEKGLKNETPN